MNPGIAIPILPARDLIETRRFYERLNFEVVGWWPDTFGGYAILTRGDLAMHFFHYPDLSPLETYAQCYWRVADVEALYTEVQALGLPKVGEPRVTPLEAKPWGMWEFAIIDPNGTLVRVGQPTRSG